VVGTGALYTISELLILVDAEFAEYSEFWVAANSMVGCLNVSTGFAAVSKTDIASEPFRHPTVAIVSRMWRIARRKLVL